METDRLQNKNKFSFKKLLKQRELFLLLIIVVMSIIFGMVNSGFWQPGNFKSMARGFTIDGVVLLGMCFMLVMGVFDISVASTMALCSYIYAKLAVGGLSVPLAALVALLLGAVIGTFNGLIITKVNVNPFIATLGTQTIVRGFVLAISQGRPVRETGEYFVRYSTTEWFGIPAMFIIFALIVVVSDLLMRRIRFFRQLYFIGGNETSAELIGINVSKTKMIFFILISMLAAIAGMLSASRLEGAVPNAYVGLEMKLIVACVIGGCSLDGGSGSMIGSVLGLVFLYILDNGLIMLRVDMYWFTGVLGIFLIGVVALNTLSANAERRRQKAELEEKRRIKQKHI